MRWAILTPSRCVRWNGHVLAFGPGAQREDAPAADAGEQLWLTCYEHIFNPARLKLKMMQKEMPRRYWHNLPEAALIQPLVAQAEARSGRMVDQGGTVPAHRRPAASSALVIAPPTLLHEGIAAGTSIDWDIVRVVTDIESLRGLRSGSVRVASTEGFASEFLPQLIADFQREYQGIRFALEVCDQAQIPPLLRHGDMDIGLTFGTSSERDIQVERRHAAPILAVMAPDHPLASRRQLSLAQIVGYPLTLPAPASTLRQLFDISCGRQGLTADAALLVNRLDPALAFAEAGGGIALSGELAVRSRLKAGSVVAIALRDREMNERHFEVQTLAGRTLPSACRAFLGHLQEVLQLDRSW